jgi:hypothetical protein
MKIGYIIAAYFGVRATPHPNNINDKLYYLRVQLKHIDKLNTKLDKIYITCTFDDLVDKEQILKDINELIIGRDNIIISHRENLGGSYCGFHEILKYDNGDCDYMVISEDDYTFGSNNAISNMLDYFEDEPDLFNLCSIWWEALYRLRDSTVIPYHPAISNGMFNNKMYHESRKKGLDFQLVYEYSTYPVMWENNAAMLEPYRKAGYKIRDYRDKYKLRVPEVRDTERIFGNPEGAEIFIPISIHYLN